MKYYAIRNFLEDISEDVYCYESQSRQFRPQGAGQACDKIGTVRFISHLLTPSLMTCVLYRISHWMWRCGLIWFAVFFSRINKIILRASIHPAARIGGGLYIPHPAHIVLYGHAGKKLTVYSGGALLTGSPIVQTWRALTDCPTLGDNVVIGSKTVIKGSVVIGDRSVVALRLFLEEDVPSDHTVLPARLRQYQINQ